MAEPSAMDATKTDKPARLLQKTRVAGDGYAVALAFDLVEVFDVLNSNGLVLTVFRIAPLRMH